MKQAVQLVSIQVKWSFQDGGTFIRALPVGGFQAEVDSRNLRIYSRDGSLVVNQEHSGMKHGMDLAGFKIARLIEGAIV